MIFSKVLLATDFSKPSLQLLDCITELNTHGLKQVVLVHVIDVNIPGGAALTMMKYDEDTLTHTKERLEAIGLEVDVKVVVGFPAYEIVRIAEEEKASLIAVASHGNNIIKRIFLGETALDVLRTSTVPVIIEKFIDIDKESCAVICANRFKRILLPVDFSLSSNRVLEEIKDLAGEIDELLLLSVIEKARDSRDLERITAEREARLQELKNQFEALGIKTRTLLEQGSASPHIVDTAEREDVSLIVMGRRGRGKIKELLLGSTAHAVARRAGRPVLIIP